ncbi:MAG: 2-oxoacid:acceptor oxidoreductase family protein [Candidatus Brocadiia bacterium]
MALGTVELIFAGFGGQGVLLMGRVLSQAAMNRNIYTSFIPSYGPEMRGGTANCKVVVSEDEVGSPIVETPDVLVALNRPSLERFEKSVKPGGIIIVNSSLIPDKVKRADVKTYYVACNDIAREAGSEKAANFAALGGLFASQAFFSLDDAEAAIETEVGKKHAQLLEVNKKALREGYKQVTQS